MGALSKIKAIVVLGYCNPTTLVYFEILHQLMWLMQGLVVENRVKVRTTKALILLILCLPACWRGDHSGYYRVRFGM